MFVHRISSHRRRVCAVGVGVMAMFLPSAVAATTVIPPTFQQLVAQAEIAIESEVIAIQPRLTNERDATPIVTSVTFRVLRTLKGKVGPTVVLDFLGGTVDDRTLHIDGMPTFHVGDRDVLFAVTSQRFMSPLVGLMHGRVRIVTDPATRQMMVRRFDGQPLRELSTSGLTAQPLLSQTPSMSLAAFEDAVVAEVARQTGRVQ
jgi:hypothetical protein